MTVFFPFIQPDSCERRAIRTTSRNVLGQHVMATRKKLEVFHRIIYDFQKLSSRQYRIIDDHFRQMDGGVTSFYVVNWGDPRPISSIDGDRVIINNIYGLSSNLGDGGNNVVLWVNTGDYGNECTISANVLTDKTKAWDNNEWNNHKLMDSIGDEFNASSINANTSNTFAVTTGSVPKAGAYDIHRYHSNTIASIDAGQRKIRLDASPGLSYSAWEQFVLPVYECFFEYDELGLESDGFNPESSDNYGAFWTGEITFIQKGTGV